MYLSTSHPGINTSPQPQFEVIPKKYLEDEIPKLHYDGDESDNVNADPNDEEHFEAVDVVISGTEFYRFYASSLPDLAGSSSMSTSTYSLQQDDPDIILGLAIPTRRKKLRKRRSESESEFPSKNHRRSLLSIAKSIHGVSFVESTPIHVEIPPLRSHWDMGRRRGVSGCRTSMLSNQQSQNLTADTSYLEVTLFTLFYYSDQYDEWVLNEEEAKGFPTHISKQVRGLLRKEILYSIRTSYICPSLSIQRLFKSLFPTSQPYTLEFSRFFRYFMESVLTLPETVHYTNGSSRLVHVLKDNSDMHSSSSFDFLFGKKSASSGTTSPMTVQTLFEKSLGDLKLLSIPHPGLFLAVENPLVVPHPAILPNIQLDLSRTLIQLSDDNETEQESDQYYPKTRAKKSTSRAENKFQSYFGAPLCKWFRSMCKVVYEYLQNLVQQLPNYSFDDSLNQSLITETGSIDDDPWSDSRQLLLPKDGQTPARHVIIDNGCNDFEESTIRKKNKQKNKGKLVLALDLMAVICLEHSATSYQHQYTAFVRCGQNPRRGWSSWVYFTPCDAGAPLVRRVEDVGKWLSRLEKKPEKLKSSWTDIPSDVQTMLNSSTFFIYTPKPDYESQNTLFSYVNEC